jgi:peptidoglycan/LPS O-acetylase OafA/YrhL
MRSGDQRSRNNFDILRLVLASMVVISHCVVLSLEPSIAWMRMVGGPALLGGPGVVAVQGFFAISGCLVIASYERSSSLRSYFEKRARRILPGYWGALLFVLVLGIFFTSLSPAAFLISPETWKFIGANLTFANFLHPWLPGLFQQNPGDPAVNGALWTIKIEVMFYLAVPFIAVACRRFGQWQTLLAICVSSVVFNYAMVRIGQEKLSLQLPGQLSFFTVGMFAHYYEGWFRRNARAMWLLAICGCLGFMYFRWFALESVGVPLLVMCIALLTRNFEGPAKYGDFSFGVYILHYPVVQTLVALGFFHAHPYLAVACVALIVAVLGVLSWNLVESRFLKRRGAPLRVDLVTRPAARTAAVLK